MVKRFWIGLMTILLAIAVTITVNYAWFINGFDVDPLATGSSQEIYYHSGTGTDQDPYIITTPRHLYNLAWLQYLGAYNKDKKDGTSFPATYFKVGLTSGITIDMTGWPLPPIGTTKYPFIGNFNGNGATISNLTTTNKFSEFVAVDKHPSGVDSQNFEADNCGAIGFFGSVGPYNGNVISESDYLGDFTYDSTHNKVYNFYLNNTNVQTERRTTLIGAVAGYVNAQISNVGVIQPHLNIDVAATSKLTSKTTNISDFAVVGYAEEAYTTQKTKSSTIIYNPTYDYSHFNFQGMGSQLDWGGSMNMSDLYNRLVSIYANYASANQDYIYSEIQYQNLSKNNISLTTASSSIKNYNIGNANGSYIWNSDNTDASGGPFNYLTALYKDVIKVTKTNETVGGYKISSSNGYLNINSTRVNNTLNFTVALSTGNNSSSATTWILDDYKLYTYNEDDGYRYYLVANNDLSLSVSNNSSSASSWYWNSEKGSYATTVGTTEYYLNYFLNEWSIKPIYAISDGNGNYLKYDSSFSSVTDISNATLWRFSNNGAYPNGTIRNTSGQYLRHTNGTLNVSNTNSNNIWYNNNNQLYISYNNKAYYLQLQSNTWQLVTPTTFYIQYNGNYLYLGNNGAIQTDGTTNKNEATEFMLSNNLSTINGSGKISATIGNKTYYLRYTGNTGTFDTTTTQNSGSTWNNDGNGLYVTYSSDNYYLQYSGKTGWFLDVPTQKTVEELVATNSYYISYDGNYLNATTTGVSASSTPNTAWFIDSNNHIYTKINGTNYYFYYKSWNSSTLGVTTNSNASYMPSKSGNSLLTYSYYIYYNGSNWTDSSTSYTLTWDVRYETQYHNEDDFENTPCGSAVASNLENLVFTNKYNITINSSSIYRITRSAVKKEAEVYNYIPLNASSTSPYTIDPKNTGYIMSGAYDGGNYQGRDIRVSEYKMYNINQNGNVTLNNNAFQSFGTNKIRTVTGENSNSIDYIIDDNNSFVKYTASKKNLTDSLKGQTNLYGLHFMSADISINHLITAPEVTINKTTYTNYQMPEDCIDFTLASKGFINFFAGTYYKGNNSFFSLHQIIRNETDANNDGKPDNPVITAIKHIDKIYKANSNYGDDYKSADYVYLYTDGTYSISNFESSKYDLAFRKEWIEEPGTYAQLGNNNQSSMTNARGDVFYFEIPVNKGEFALGSVSGRTGAYLFYLDIGANAAAVDRTEITQQTSYSSESYVYSNGIQILDGTVQTIAYTSDSNSAVATIPANTTGTINIVRTGDSISIGSGLTSTYYDSNITFNGNLVPIDSSSSVSNVLRYVDHIRSDDTIYYTTIYNSGGDNLSYDCYRINSDGTKTLITGTGEGAEYGLLKIVGVTGTSAELTDSYFNFTPSTTTKILDYYSYILTSNVNDLSDTNEMIVVEDSSVVPEATDEYTYEHSYHISGNNITMAPNGLVVYIGPDVKASATVSGVTNDVATVTVRVGDTTYTFTFNAGTTDPSNKTITISYTTT